MFSRFPRRLRDGRTFAILGIVAALPGCAYPEEANPVDAHAGTIVFNDNGGWCWYQDERVVVDQVAGKLLIGSAASGGGRSGAVDVVTYDLATGTSARFQLDDIGKDDHNAPALFVRPDGRYLAMYTNHNVDKLTRYRISTSPHDGSSFGAKKLYDWKAEIDSDYNATYNNLFYLSGEGRIYDFVRADKRSPNMLVSEDYGDTWEHAGRLTQTGNVGYVNGYFKFASNGVDRIDFLATEHHPRDYDTSVYHGYLKGGKLYASDGTVVDDDAFDDQAPEPSDFTPVFVAGTAFDGETLTHGWIAALRLDEGGNPYAILTARANDDPENTNFEDHRFLYARFDGQAWTLRPLAKAGARLYEKEEDYTGLGALDPSDPNRLFISTAVDPRDGTPTDKHELYEGVTGDGGASWTWKAITEGSKVDNLRPVVPIWDGKQTALIWLRGTYTSMWTYDLEVVGKIF